jgi:hypothetical protein
MKGLRIAIIALIALVCTSINVIAFAATASKTLMEKNYSPAGCMACHQGGATSSDPHEHPSSSASNPLNAPSGSNTSNGSKKSG